MKKRIYTLILPAFLACLGFATSARAGVCFVVGGDCGEFNKIMELKDCSDLGYNYTADNCPLPAKKLDGGQCKDKDDNVRYEKCICNPDYYQYDKTASDAYKYTYGDCCGDFCHTRTCKAEYKYPTGMTNGIKQYGETCDNKSIGYACPTGDYSKTAKDGYVTSPIRGGTSGEAYSATCYAAKTCSSYSQKTTAEKNTLNANNGYKCQDHSQKLGATTGTCWSCIAKTCSDYAGGWGDNTCGSDYDQSSQNFYLGSTQGTCYKCTYNPCKNGSYNLTSCPSGQYCAKSNNCYRLATCNDIDHVALSGGSYTGNATISSSSTTQNGYTTPSSTYNGSVTYYPKSGLTISGINPSMTESGNVTLSMNSNTCYWSRPYTCDDLDKLVLQGGGGETVYKAVGVTSRTALNKVEDSTPYHYYTTGTVTYSYSGAFYGYIGDKKVVANGISAGIIKVNGQSCVYAKKKTSTCDSSYIYRMINSKGSTILFYDPTGGSYGGEKYGYCATQGQFRSMIRLRGEYTGQGPWYAPSDILGNNYNKTFDGLKVRIPTWSEMNFINNNVSDIKAFFQSAGKTFNPKEYTGSSNYDTAGFLEQAYMTDYKAGSNPLAFWNSKTDSDDRNECWWASVDGGSCGAVVLYSFDSASNGSSRTAVLNHNKELMINNDYVMPYCDNGSDKKYSFGGKAYHSTATTVLNNSSLTNISGCSGKSYRYSGSQNSVVYTPRISFGAVYTPKNLDNLINNGCGDYMKCKVIWMSDF